MSSLPKAKPNPVSSSVRGVLSRLEPLEPRWCFSALAPAAPQGISATYELGYTFFRWQDTGSASTGNDLSTAYVVESSPTGTGNWTALPSISAAAAAPNGLQDPTRLYRYPHDRQKFYRMHAVDADGQVSADTSVIKVALHPEDSVIQASASAAPSGPITLSWLAKADLTYNISRRDLGSTGTFAPLNTVAVTPSGTAGTYVDTTAASGVGYEYSIFSSAGTRTYVVAGGNLAAVEGRGKIVLLVDDTVAGALRGYIARLQSDLIGDGWTVLRHNVYRNQPVASVKELIQRDYNAALQPNGVSDVKQVMLIGHVPIPYSGDVDVHTEHYGAWPTDAYYGDMDGVWTDSTVDTTDAIGPTTGYYATSNAPGDKRFDQNYLTMTSSDSKNVRTAPEIAVGRVDMYDMPLAGLSEVELLKRYLSKDHEYRTGAWNVRQKAIIYDNWPATYDGAGVPAYTNLSALVGSGNIDAGNYFPDKTAYGPNENHTYIWGWADGAGYDPTQFWGAGYATSNSGGAGDFLNEAMSADVVFNQIHGSFIADWHHQNSFLRAAIAGPGHGLTSYSAVGAAAQFWHMGMGETVGENLVYTQRGQPRAGTNEANGLKIVNRYTALMGDPTLRMAIVKPATNVQAVPNGQGGVFINWTPSNDPAVLGYRVYRASSMNGQFVKVSGDVQGTSFVDTTGTGIDAAGKVKDVYMVRAIKLEQGNTGSYFNLSQGAFSQVQSGLTVGIGRTSRAYVGSVALTFTQPVILNASGVTLQRRVSGGGLVNQNFALSTDDNGLSYVVTLLNAQSQPMAFGDGVYDVSVNPANVSLTGTGGLLNEAKTTHTFTRYAGDADGDGGISINDFNILSESFGSNRNLDSDSDNDNGISIDDFNELSSRFGKSVWALIA